MGDGIVDEKHGRRHGLDDGSFPEVRRHVRNLAREERGKDQISARDRRADVVAVGHGRRQHGEKDDGPGEVPEVVE